MNLKTVHPADKGVAAKVIFKTETGNAMALQILEGETLQKHFTATKGFLLCVSGEVLFEYERGESIALAAGDFLEIIPMEKHWVKGVKSSHLVLMR